VPLGHDHPLAYASAYANSAPKVQAAADLPIS
jgi:hypothetical protein